MSNNIKILCVSHRMNRSGAPQSLFSIVKEFGSNEKLELFVVGMKGGPLVKDYNEAGCETLELCRENSRGIFSSLVAMFKLIFLMYKANFDVVLINSAANIRALIAAKLTGTRSVLYVREHDEMLSKNAFKLYIRKKSILLSDKIIAVSESNKQWSMHVGYPESRISVIHNGLDFCCIEKLATCDPEIKFIDFISNRKVVSIVGYMSYRKGIDLFLSVAKSIREKSEDYAFVVIGDFEKAEERKRFDCKVKEYDLSDSVYVSGFTDNVYKYLKHSTVNCMMSRSESLPRVVLESIAIGVPVVAFNVGGTHELLPNDYPYLVKCFDSDEFSKNVLIASELGPAMSEKLQAYSRGFDVSICAERVLLELNSVGKKGHA